MIRITLIALAALATVAAATPASAQAGAPVRTLGSADVAATATALPAERKATPCSDRNCSGKPAKRGFVMAAPLGW